LLAKQTMYERERFCSFLFLKYFTLFIIFFNFFLNLHAAEKQSIINRLSEINNFTFNFEQITKEKIETGKLSRAIR